MAYDRIDALRVVRQMRNAMPMSMRETDERKDRGNQRSGGNERKTKNAATSNRLVLLHIPRLVVLPLPILVPVLYLLPLLRKNHGRMQIGRKETLFLLWQHHWRVQEIHPVSMPTTPVPVPMPMCMSISGSSSIRQHWRVHERLWAAFSAARMVPKRIISVPSKHGIRTEEGKIHAAAP